MFTTQFLLDFLALACRKGASVFSSVSGGKDGQCATKKLHEAGIPLSGLIHADLGEMEWKESLPMCERLAEEFSQDLYVVQRSDGRGLLEHMEVRMAKQKAKEYAACDVATREEITVNKQPFWPSKSERYCTSDLKRDVINKFLRSVNSDFVISCEGIRADESNDRGEKSPVSIRWQITSTYYKEVVRLDYYKNEMDMLADQVKAKQLSKEDYNHRCAEMEMGMVQLALKHRQPGKRLALTVYPVFYYSLQEVWMSYGMSKALLQLARLEYNQTGIVPEWWSFHPAYVYGNDRVSCVFCIPFASFNDLQVGARHRPELLQKLIGLQTQSGFTFRHKKSLEELVA